MFLPCLRDYYEYKTDCILRISSQRLSCTISFHKAKKKIKKEMLGIKPEVFLVYIKKKIQFCHRLAFQITNSVLTNC